MSPRGPVGTPTQPTMPLQALTWGARPSGAKVHVCDWSESAMLRFWHVGHRVGGTLTPDANARTEVMHAMAVLHQNGRSAAATGGVVGLLNATRAAAAGLELQLTTRGQNVCVQPSQSSHFVGSLGSDCTAMCAILDPGPSPCVSSISKIHGQVSPRASKAFGYSLSACSLACLFPFGWDSRSSGKPTA